VRVVQVGEMQVPVYTNPRIRPVFVHPVPGYAGHVEVRSLPAVACD